MNNVDKLTVSLPRDLIAFTKELARKRNISRSKVVAQCLQEKADEYTLKEMEEGYRLMSDEQRKFANIASTLAHEVLPEWE